MLLGRLLCVRVHRPPDEVFPLDLQGPPATGPRAGRGSLHLSEPFFDDLPADDWAG